MAEELKPTSASDYRSRSTYLFRVNDNLTVRLKTLDFTTIVLTNMMPFHLLKAAQKFENMQRTIATALDDKGEPEGVKAADVLNALDPKDLDSMTEFLRRYACIVVVEPRLMPEDDGNPEHLSVTELSGDELMAIFYARPPAARKDAPVVDQTQAEEFRRAEPAAPHPLPQGSAGVRDAAKLLDFPEREAIFG